MPGGKVHSALTIATALGVLAPYAVVNLHGDPYLYVAGNLAGVMLTPDHDVDGGNFTDTIIRRISPKAQWLWRLFWTPYALVIPHRGKLSHFPVLGTLVRLGYILVVVNLLSAVIRLVLSIFMQIDTVFLWWWSWSFFFGLCHVDAIHWMADLTIKGKEQFIDE